MGHMHICGICKGRIDVGIEEMIVDDSDSTFHKSCVEKAIQTHEVHFPAAPVKEPPPSPPAPPLSPPAAPAVRCQRCGAEVEAAVISCRRCYLDLCPACTAAGCCGSRPAQHGEKTYCLHCKKPCKLMCPYCDRYVHNSYDLSGTCGIEHEVICNEAHLSREGDLGKPKPAGRKKPVKRGRVKKKRKGRARR